MYNYLTTNLVLIFLVFLNFQLIAQLHIKELTDSVFVYTTYQNINGNPFPSNSVYYLTTEGIVMIDTPWDESQLMPLLDSMRVKHGMQPVLCIPTHFHDDRTAGLERLDSLGVRTYSTAMTKKFCEERSEEAARYTFQGDTTFIVGNKRIESYYPGAGHSPDNIVIYLPEEKILIGGCFVKSYQAEGLGYTGDARLKEWLTSIRKVKKKYRRSRYVVTGHEAFKNKSSLRKTASLLKKSLSKN